MAKAPSDIKSLARSHTESAIKVLAGIMTKTDAPAAARVAAASVLLDRGWGKAEIKAEVITTKYVVEVPAIIESAEQWAASTRPH